MKSELKLIEAGALLEMSYTVISKMIHGKASLTFATAERIAYQIGTDLPEMLIEGRTLLGMKTQHKDKGAFLDPFEKDVEAFRFCLLDGGEGTKVIRDLVFRLAEEKRSAAINEPATATLAGRIGGSRKTEKGNEAAR